MKIPNINCKYYTSYGKCLVRKGWIFQKRCVKLDDLSCDLREMYPRPSAPIGQQPRPYNMPFARPICKPRNK